MFTGMDVVNKIGKMPTDPGDAPIKPVMMNSVVIKS